MSLSYLLTLSGGLEQQYWAAERTQQNLRRFDILGLAGGVFINAVMTIAPRLDPHVRMYIGLVGVLMLAQLSWLLAKPEAYTRHRPTVNVCQLVRQLGTLMVAFDRVAPEAVLNVVHLNRSLQPGSTMAFLTIFVILPM